MKKATVFLLSAVLLRLAWIPLSPPSVHAQSQVVNRPDCYLPFFFSTTAINGTTSLSSTPIATAALDNRYLNCTTWTLTYQVTGLSGVSIEFDGAPDSNGAAGSFSTWTNLFSGTLPLTSTSYSQISGYSFAPWLEVLVNSVTGNGQITGALVGYRAYNSNASSGSTPISLPAITYTAAPSTLSDGQSASDVDITNNRGVTVAVLATSDGKVAFTPCDVKSGTGTLNDTTNHANCKASPGNFYGATAINTTSTLAYLRMYNLTTDPTCSSATGFVRSYPIPAQTGGSGFDLNFILPINFSTGISYCVTGGGANNDNTAPPAGVYIVLKTK